MNNFDSDELYITTACVAGLLRDDDSINNIMMPLYEHFGKNLFLEIQSHPQEIQKVINEKAKYYSTKLGLNLIAACDSHYIYPEQSADRRAMLNGKGIEYNEEDEFILDYPDYDTLYDRFVKQGVFTKSEIEQALEQTLIFDDCEDIYLDKEIKMPTIYPELNDEQKLELLAYDIDKGLKKLYPNEWEHQRRINTNNGIDDYRNYVKKILNIGKLKQSDQNDKSYEDNILSLSTKYVGNDELPDNSNDYMEPTKDGLKAYLKSELAIRHEFYCLLNTISIHTSDYFLFNTNLIELAIKKYGGILTRTGRGSCAAYLINRMLGITQIDRTKINLPLYPERFMSEARLLENRAMPDIDMNVVDQKPFVDAAKELLGEYSCYPMVAYGTMKIGEAFRNICRAHNLDFYEYNEIAKNIEKYYDDEKWKPLIEEAQKYIDTVISISPHPCAHLIMDKDIREEIGITKIGDVYCALITSSEADEWKYLKDDFLVVSVWLIISDVFKEIGQDILTVDELDKLLDDKVWSLFEKGLTCTLNQVDGEWATSLIKKYKPRSKEELAKFVACIRPSFNSLRDTFISRTPYTSGSKYIDNIFYQTDNFILFQENIMSYFEKLGIPPSESIGLIKKISKKHITQEDFDTLEERLLNGWIKLTGSEDGFRETWDNMQDSLNYSFNSSHAIAVAEDSLYCAYLKANYPLQYYTVCFNIYSKDEDKTARLTSELQYFKIKLKNIKFRYSRSQYSYDIDTNIIYKSVGSIKFMNADVAEELYELRNNTYNGFIDVLYDLKNISINSKQLDILIKLDYFSEFGNSAELLQIVEYFNLFKQGEAKMMSKNKFDDGIIRDIVERYSKVTEKKYILLSVDSIIKEIEEYIILKQIDDFSVPEKISYQLEYLGYIALDADRNDKLANRKVVITDIKKLKQKSNGRIWAVQVSTYSLVNHKNGEFTIYNSLFTKKELKKYDIIVINDYHKQNSFWYIDSYDKVT